MQKKTEGGTSSSFMAGVLQREEEEEEQPFILSYVHGGVNAARVCPALSASTVQCARVERAGFPELKNARCDGSIN